MLNFSYLSHVLKNLIACNIMSRAGIQPLDADVGKWLRKLAPNVRVKVLLNKAEGMHDDANGSLMAVMGEAYSLGFGTPVAISAESGQGLADLYEDLRPWVERAQEEMLAKRAGSYHALILCDGVLRVWCLYFDEFYSLFIPISNLVVRYVICIKVPSKYIAAVSSAFFSLCTSK